MTTAETFEQRLARLEEIVEQLEGDGIDLARALALFEEGIQHLRGAAEQLAGAEVRVQRLIEQTDGSFDVVERE
jgi:exodeoxyribonuclease VII small subunit